MTAPLVSVIVPVLHDTPELVALLDGLGAHPSTPPRGDPGYEVIVVNGDPDDASMGPVQGVERTAVRTPRNSRG